MKPDPRTLSPSAQESLRIRAAKRAGLKVLAVANSHAGKELAEADYLTETLTGVRLP